MGCFSGQPSGFKSTSWPSRVRPVHPESVPKQGIADALQFWITAFFYFSVAAMLKVTFTDTGLSLECLRGSLESLLADRVGVHVRTQRAVTVEPSGASIPLPANLPGLQTLHRYSEVSLSRCDRDWVEVSLQGVWLAEDHDQGEGVFFAELSSGLEQRLRPLWHHAKGVHASPMRL